MTVFDDRLAWAAGRWEVALDEQVMLEGGDDPIAAADAMTSLDDARVAFVQAALDKTVAELAGES